MTGRRHRGGGLLLPVIALAWLAWLACLWSSSPAQAQDAASAEWLASERHATIVMRVLAYDQRVKLDVTPFFRLAVVSEVEDARSSEVSQRVIARVERLSRQMTLAGHTVLVTGAPMPRDERRLLATLGTGFHALYLAPGLADDDVCRLIRLAQARGLATITGERRYERLGVAVVVTLVEGLPRVRVNLKASERAGMELSSQVLQIADPIEDPVVPASCGLAGAAAPSAGPTTVKEGR